MLGNKGNAIVRGDGDGVKDFEILLNGLVDLIAGLSGCFQ